MFITGTQHLNPILSIAGRTIVCGPDLWLYWHGFDGSVTGERHEDLAAFYEAPEEHPEIPEKYGASYVYVSSYERGDYDVDEEGLARIGIRIFENGEASIYRLVSTGIKNQNCVYYHIQTFKRCPGRERKTQKNAGKGMKHLCLRFTIRMEYSFRPDTGGTDHYLMISMSSDSTTKTAAAILVPSASLASKVLDLDLLMKLLDWPEMALMPPSSEDCRSTVTIIKSAAMISTTEIAVTISKNLLDKSARIS